MAIERKIGAAPMREDRVKAFCERQKIMPGGTDGADSQGLFASKDRHVARDAVLKHRHFHDDIRLRDAGKRARRCVSRKHDRDGPFIPVAARFPREGVLRDDDGAGTAVARLAGCMLLCVRRSGIARNAYLLPAKIKKRAEYPAQRSNNQYACNKIGGAAHVKDVIEMSSRNRDMISRGPPGPFRLSRLAYCA